MLPLPARETLYSADTASAAGAMGLPPSFATLVQTYFTEYLTQQRALSPRTVATYRDALVHFLQFAEAHLGKAPVAMTLAEITPQLITAFLAHLEEQRHNCVRSRNARLAALRSFLKFAGHRDLSALRIPRSNATGLRTRWSSS